MKYLFFMLFSLALTFQANSQTKGQAVDKIIQRNYNIIECKVTKITDKEIEYLELGNTVVFTIETSKVAAIHFANGAKKEFASANVSESVKEVENANKPSPSSIKQQEQVTAKSNVIAVLPVVYVNTATLQKSSDLSKFAQNDIYTKLLDKSSNIFPLTVQDTRVTNSLLRKANIDYNNIDEITIEELRGILGVDHIIAGKVAYTTRTIVTSNSSSSTNVSSEGKELGVKNNNGSISQDDTKYDYIVYFDMYRNNDKIYSKTRQPMLSFKDSWMDSMQYLLKRSPVYTK